MKISTHLLFKSITIAAFCAVLMACSSTATKTSQSENGAVAQAEFSSAMNIYEVHHDGRMHVFYDRELYLDFLQLGESPYRLTRIGAGPNGETLVFGLTKADKKRPGMVDAIKLYDNQIPPATDFYAEMRKHGRVYVFDQFADMQPVRDFGHPNFFYTEIGAGPNGETVVFVLNKSNKKQRPETLIARFKAMQ